MNPAIGEITCPHCGNENATVHKEKKGRTQALYYRCQSCGTIQCRYPGGQAFINKNARWYTPDNQEAREVAGAAAAAEARAEVAEVAHKKAAEQKQVPEPTPQRRGFFERLSENLNKEIL